MSDEDEAPVPSAGAPQPSATAPAPAHLRDWVRQHEMSWEIGPHLELVHHQKLQIGWELRLHAQVPEGIDPGTPRTDLVHERLREIVAHVLPEGLRYDVEPFDSAFHLRPENDFEPEVELLVMIFRSQPTEDVREEEKAPLQEMGRRLAALGARDKVWRH